MAAFLAFVNGVVTLWLALIVLAAAATTTNETPPVSGRIAEQIGETTVWVATIVTLFWTYALASTIFTTGVYHLQQRRLRAADPST